MVQVLYTSVPQASSPAGAHDALNPANYTLAGPSVVTITAVTQVGGNPLAYDLYISSAMDTGAWVVTVSNVLDPFNVSLTIDFADFTVAPSSVIPPLVPPVQFDVPIIRKHLSPALQGENWDGVIAALEQGDIYNRQNAELAFNQLFVSTASGPYLTAQASNYGVQQPPNVGMSDSLFRQLVISLNTNKVVQEAIREILEVFYGQDSLRAYAQSGVDAPYNLSGGVYDLQWLVDETTAFSYTFQNTDFESPGMATALEVAAVLTRVMEQAGTRAFATNFASPTSSGQRVRIYSPSLGLRSSVRITGGRAQNVLDFPTLVNPYLGTVTSYSWVYTRPVQGTTLLTLTTTGTPLFNAAVLQAGDYVVIQSSGSGTPFQGTYEITAVTYEYSGSNLVQTIAIPQIAYTGTYIQTANSGYTFYRPTKNGVYQPNGRTVIVSQSVPGRVDISIPATTAAVNRTLQDAAYLHANPPLSIERYQRTGGVVTLTFASPHGLLAGAQIYIDNAQPSTAIPFIDFPIPGAGATSLYQNAASLCTCVSEVGYPPAGSAPESPGFCQLSNGQILIAGGYDPTSGASTTQAQRFQLTSTTTIADGTEATGATAYNTQWVTTASLNAARGAAPTAPFSSNAVICGGYATVSSTFLSSTEVYDPTANTWTTSGAMSTARDAHLLIPLSTGQLIAIGGRGAAGALASCELFNGSSWAATGTMNDARNGASGILLPNKSVLVSGGIINQATSALSKTAELYSAGTWSYTGLPTWWRVNHSMILLPDGRVLVVGGSGWNASLGTYAASPVAVPATEIYDPNTGRWSLGPPTLVGGRVNPGLVYVPTTNRIYCIGGDPSGIYTVEYMDISTMRWHFSPAAPLQADIPVNAALLAPGAIFFYTGQTGSGDTATPELLALASETVASGGINTLFATVASVPSATTLTYGTNQDVEDQGYTSNFANFNPTGFALSLSRASGTVTATMTLPTGYVVNLQPGDFVYINVLASSGLVSGLKTVIAATDTVFTYAEIGGSVGPITDAALSLDVNATAIATPWAEQPAVAPFFGPYIYDPTGGLAITAGSGTTVLPIYADQQYDYIEVSPTTDFPATGGYVALGFGYQNATPPIKLLDVYTDPTSGNTRLVIDFSYRFTSSFPVGSNVVLLYSKAPYEPLTPAQYQTGGFWLTDSPSGRVAAEFFTQSSLAAGILENIVVVYPGDTGLGGAGLPTQGAQKLSDIVYVFAGDNPEAEEQAARKEVAV